MAEVVCEKVSKGMRESERTISIRDAVNGRRAFLRVESDYLTVQDNHSYLPVGVVQEEKDKGLVLIELPQEPDAGSTRLWVRFSDLLQSKSPA